MSKKDNPYINNLSLKEVEFAEANHYYLQVGDETVEFDGRQTFTKEKAEYLFDELLLSMQDMSRNGTDKDKIIARLGLINFRMHKLRIH